MNNTALIRLKKEFEMMIKDPPDNFVAKPLENDLFTWHFTIRGPEETEFENGFYHGVVKLPTGYPYKPPNIMFLNQSGRFDINIDVCLSMTKYHKEEWQAAWTIRTMLEAITAFFPIKEEKDAIGAIDYPAEVRKKFALQSQKWKCESCGLISELVPPRKTKPVHSTQNQQSPTRESKNSMDNNHTVGHNALDDNTSMDNQISANSSEADKRQDEREDKDSEISSIGKKSESDIKSDMKIGKIKKIKKIDVDKKIHTSIETIIFEEIEEENDEKDLTNDKLKLGKSLSTYNKDSKKKETQENTKNYNLDSSQETTLKRQQSDTVSSSNPDNFSDYLKQIRRSQFEEKINGDSNDQKSKEDQKNMLLNKLNELKKNKQQQSSSGSDLPQVVTENTVSSKKELVTLSPEEIRDLRLKEQIQNLGKEELEFFEAAKSMKSISIEHFNKNFVNIDRYNAEEFEFSNEITKLQTNNPSYNKEGNHETQHASASNLSSKSNMQQQYADNLKTYNKQKERLEKLFKQKTSAMKYMDIEAYKKARNNRVIFTFALLVLCIFGIFSTFSYYKGSSSKGSA